MNINARESLDKFESTLSERLRSSALDKDVAGFKSIVCYRTGMDVSVSGSKTDEEAALQEVFNAYREQGKIRLEHKPLNDLVVRITLGIAGRFEKPGISRHLLKRKIKLTCHKKSSISYRTWG